MSEEIVPTDSVSELVQIVDMFVRPSAGWFVTNFVFSEGDRLVFAGGAGLHTTSSMDIEMVGPAYHGEWRCVEPNPLSRFLSRFQFDGDGYFVRLTAQAWSAPDDAQGDTAPSFANKCLGSVYISEIGSAVWKKVMACIENPIELSGLVPDIVRAMFRPDAISATMRIEVFRALTPCTDQKV